MQDRTVDANAQPAPAAAGTHGLKAKAIQEGRKFLFLFFYLWVLFGVFVLNQSIVLREQGLGFTAQGFALVNALVLAKVMLLFEAFDPGRWLRRGPLIIPILFIAVHVLEKVIEGLFHGKTVADSLPSIGGGGLAGLLSAGVIMFVALVPFFGFRNLSLALGEDRLRALLFSRPSDTARSGPR